jgi:thiamine transport system ATP-binding protein
MLSLKSVEYSVGEFKLKADFEIPRLAKVALIGPSGAGKSTLFSLISGFLKPKSGSIFIDNEDVTTKLSNQRRVTTIFQDGNLFPHLTVKRNISLGLRPDLRLNSEQRGLLDYAIDRVGLTDLVDRKPGSLSGGQQSRVSLARALGRDCPLLLLDEPFSALGPSLKSDMIELVDQISNEKKLTVLFVTHDPEDAKKICDLSIIVSSGCVSSPMATKELFENPPEILRDYL